MMKVTKEVRLVCHNIAGMSETSVHILDKVVLIKGRFFVGGMIEAHLLEVKGVPCDTTPSAQIFWRCLDVHINVVMFSYKKEDDYRNQWNQ
jgi:hypothetical protein